MTFIFLFSFLIVDLALDLIFPPQIQNFSFKFALVDNYAVEPLYHM